MYDVCANAYPEADVRDVHELVNTVVQRYNGTLQCNVALHRLLDEKQMPGLIEKIIETRRTKVAFLLSKGPKVMSMW